MIQIDGTWFHPADKKGVDKLMKIGQFSDSFIPVVDGVGRVVYNYCETIARKGHECYAIVPLDKFGYRGRYPFDIIDYYSTSLKIMPQYDVGLPIFDQHFKARLDMTDLDLVHVHTPFIAGIEGIRYAKEHKVPIIGTFHSKYYDDFLQITGSKHMAELGTDIIVSFYNHCDEVWAVSENSADTLRSYGYEGPLKVIPNGMDVKQLDPYLSIRAKEYFHIDDDPCLLFVGQMNWKKNIAHILEAAALLKKEGIAFNLILAGKGPHVGEIKDKIKDLGIENDTYVVGHITDEDKLFGLYQLADLFVFPSLYDNAPMVVREAANAGTPAVVVEGSSSAEIIRDRENGFYCKDDPESIAEVMKEALSYPERTRQIGEKARTTIPVAWDEIIDQVLKEYADMIEMKKNR